MIFPISNLGLNLPSQNGAGNAFAVKEQVWKGQFCQKVKPMQG
jgi:hypothetical protein